MSELYFRPGEPEGFTSKKLADKKDSYNNPIRELLQNSVDAAKEASNPQCIVSIQIKNNITKSAIPNIEKYESVLDQAVEYHEKKGSYGNNSQQVVNSVKRALEREDFTILMFTDNGVGISPDTLDALISGNSVKQDESSGGSFGVGHLTSYFLSSLRYVLYASKYKNKHTHQIEKLFSGSPILAGYQDEEGIDRGSVGRILQEVPEVPEDELSPRWEFSKDFPDFIDLKMKEVTTTGSMVAILGLNKDWDKEAEYAIANNFFHAISNDELTVSISNNNQESAIDSQRINELLYERKDGKSATSDNILSGQHTYQAWLTVTDNNCKQNIKLDNDDTVCVYIKSDIEISSFIALVRNGMLIARHDKLLSSEIASLRKNENFVPFSMIIDVNREQCPKLFSLIKDAEGPYHNELIKGKLLPGDEKKLKNLLKELSNKTQQYLQVRNREGSYVDMAELHIPSKAEVQAGNSDGASQTKKAEHRKYQPKPPPVDLNHDRRPHPPGPTPTIIHKQLNVKKSMKMIDNGNTIDIELNITPRLDNKTLQDAVYLRLSLSQDNDDGKLDSALPLLSVSLDGKDLPIEAEVQAKLGKLQPHQPYRLKARVKKPDKVNNINVALTPYFGLKQDNNNDQ